MICIYLRQKVPNPLHVIATRWKWPCEKHRIWHIQHFPWTSIHTVKSKLRVDETFKNATLFFLGVCLGLFWTSKWRVYQPFDLSSHECQGSQTGAWEEQLSSPSPGTVLFVIPRKIHWAEFLWTIPSLPPWSYSCYEFSCLFPLSCLRVSVVSFTVSFFLEKRYLTEASGRGVCWLPVQHKTKTPLRYLTRGTLKQNHWEWHPVTFSLTIYPFLSWFPDCIL